MLIKEPLIKERSKSGKIGYTLPESEHPIKTKNFISEKFLRKDEPNLPELSEIDVVRHFTRLSNLNYHVDIGMYPLGSCTMKYNPKINEEMANLSGFQNIHPLQPVETVQGALAIMFELADYLAKISGMDAVTLQPAAGAQGEFTGIKIIRAYHINKGNPRKFILVPDSAHGTNPASTTLSGYTAKTLKSNALGMIDPSVLAGQMNEDVAGLMTTNPNTLGIFESEIKKISEIVHSKGGLLYMDGANLNALLGYIRPGDIGFDVMHFNLHKTFSTPHGGGGPGSGPVGVKNRLSDFLPIPVVTKENGYYKLDSDRPLSIGKVNSFFGNFLVFIKAYTYIRMIGKDHLKEISENAVINSNYLKHLLEEDFTVAYKTRPMHEFVLSANDIKKEYGVKTLDIAKRLLDYGFHAPTIYFPLIVHEALMIEPTETESVDTLEEFANALKKIKKEIEKEPEVVQQAPHNTPVRRLNDVYAVKNLKVRW